MSKKDIIRTLVEIYHEDEEDVKNLSKKELEECLEEYEDHSNQFIHEDEFDGSHSWD